MVTVGLNIPNFGKTGTPATIRDTIARAEQAGFDLAMVSDHVAVTPDVNTAYPAPFLEAFTLLGWLAARSRLTLGTTVAVLPFRHPLLVAAMTDTLSRLTEGRFILGLGVGWARREYEALGVDFAARRRVMDDFLAAIAALRAGQDHTGPYATFHDIHSGAFDAPVWIGGNGLSAIDRAINYGQAWHPLDISIDWLRDVGLPALRRPTNRPETPALAPRIKLRLEDEAPEPKQRRPLGQGTWNQIDDDLRAVAAMGASHVVLDPDTPATRAGQDPWPALERALTTLREPVTDARH